MAKRQFRRLIDISIIIIGAFIGRGNTEMNESQHFKTKNQF